MTNIFFSPCFATRTCVLQVDLAGSIISTSNSRCTSDLMNVISSELYRREGAAMGLQSGRRNSNNRGGSKFSTIPILECDVKMIQLDIRSRSRTKNPTPTPSAVRNPTPPKNLRLRLRLRNSGNNTSPYAQYTERSHRL